MLIHQRKGEHDRFICGLPSEQIKRKLLSANYTFKGAVDAAIAQETAQKDIRDLGSNSHGKTSSGSVNKVKRNPFSPLVARQHQADAITAMTNEIRQQGLRNDVSDAA